MFSRAPSSAQLQPGGGLQLGWLLQVCQAGQMGRYKERHLPNMPPLTGLYYFAGDVLQLCRAYGAPCGWRSEPDGPPATRAPLCVWFSDAKTRINCMLKD